MIMIVTTRIPLELILFKKNRAIKPKISPKNTPPKVSIRMSGITSNKILS